MQKELVLTSVVKSKINNVDYVFKSNDLVLNYTQLIEPIKPKKRNIVEIDAPYFPQNNHYAKSCQNFCKQKPIRLTKNSCNQTTKILAQKQKNSCKKSAQNHWCLMTLIIKFFS